MSTGVERARGLERDGIPAASRAWNLSAAALYEEAIRRGEGADRRRRARWSAAPGSTPAARPTTSSSCSEPASEADIAWGEVNRPMDPAQFDAAAPATCWRR